MRAFRILVVAALAALFATGPTATVLDNLQQITDGTSNTLLFDETGDVTVTCGDGSVRTISDKTIDCPGKPVNVSGNDAVTCTDNNLKQIGLSRNDPSGANHDVVCNDGSVRVVPGNGSGTFILPFLEQASVCFA